MTQQPAQRPLSVVVIGARGIPDVEGGAEKNAEMLFPRVVAAGIRVTLLGLQKFIKNDDYRGVRLVAIRSRRFLKTDKIFFYLSAIPRVMRARPDIVHLQGLGASLFLWVYKLLGCKTVVRYGSADYVLGKWGIIGRTGFRLAEYQTRFADAVIAVTPALADRLAASGIKDNVHVIPNALDAAEVTQAPDAALVAQMDAAPFVLFVGRVTMQKNVDGLIRAFRRFREIDGRPFRLLIAGGLDDVGYVRDVVQPLLDDDVVLLDRCNRIQLEALYGRCDVFINASIHEGSSNATLEAISRRCPVIISDIPENLDFKLDPQAYFNPVDVESVAGCLAAAAREPDAFRPPHDRFLTWDDVARRTIAIYHAITHR